MQNFKTDYRIALLLLFQGPDSKKQTVILRRAGESRPDVVSPLTVKTFNIQLAWKLAYRGLLFKSSCI